MTHDQFWQIIAEAGCSDPHSAEEWDRKLTEALATLSASEIKEWDHIFDECAKEAYRTDLWAAAYIINGGASDDGFYYFRCWLIGMGQTIYSNAIGCRSYSRASSTIQDDSVCFRFGLRDAVLGHLFRTRIHCAYAPGGFNSVADRDSGTVLYRIDGDALD